MNSYGQYCPIARALEILGDRWTLLIVRDLLGGAQHFNELERGLPGIPRSLLSERLRRLQQTGLLERRAKPRGGSSYHLTAAGLELLPLFDMLVEWGARWAFGDPAAHELNPLLLLWWMRSRVCRERLPARRIVVEFHFHRAAQQETYWMILAADDVSICVQHPGFDVEVLVSGELAAFLKVWVGRAPYAEALRSGAIVVDAAPALERAFPRWFALSPVAAGVAAATRADESAATQTKSAFADEKPRLR